jgi:peptide/nickel transport system ATP-binding protein
MAQMSRLEIENLRVTYSIENSVVTALDGVFLKLPLKGSSLGVVGESGSGKTTLGMSIMGSLEPPAKVSSGTIMYEGKDVLRLSNQDLRRYQWEQVSMIYQSAMNSLNPVKKVRDPIIEVIQEHRHVSKSESTEIALKLLSEVGIKEERSGDYPHEFSGGMRQRVIIALALALTPKVLIADEPTSALDVVTQKQILALLRRKVSTSGLSLIFITHEISVLSDLVEEVAVMYAGEIVEKGALNDVFREPLHPYTEMLLSTLLTIDSDLSLGWQSTSFVDQEKRTKTDGSFPAMQQTANMCKYAFRCKYAFNRCMNEEPILTLLKNERWVACHRWT